MPHRTLAAWSTWRPLKTVVATAAFTVPSLRDTIVLILLLVIAGVAWKFVSPLVAEPFRSIAVVVVLLVFALALLRWAGLI